MSIKKDIAEAVQNGEDEEIVEYVQKALNNGIHPIEILSDGLLVGMNKASSLV